MFKLEERVRKFHETDYKKNKILYEQLHLGQNPEILFITCSDSRIVPHQLTQSKPGEIFVIRNAGNIIPNYPNPGGELSTIEYALTALNIKHIIVCGHSQCGAMQGLLQPDTTRSMPLVTDWLTHGPKREEIISQFNPKKDNSLLEKAIAENILLQIEHLKSIPLVQSKLNCDAIELHAWIYAFEEGEVHAFNSESNTFEPIVSNKLLKPIAAPETNTAFIFKCFSALTRIFGGGLVMLGLILENPFCLAIGNKIISTGTRFTNGLFAQKAPSLIRDNQNLKGDPSADFELSCTLK
ncbi:MAG: carbonic anhydrase [Legionella longbeachae]|nr:carbonic anhydrase [Legionella longbeachae]